MTFSQAVASALGKYATFQGRASRSEYWWFVLFGVAVPWISGVADILLFNGVYFIQHGDT